MTEQFRFTDNTKNYLTEFYCILDRMIRGMERACLNNSVTHNFIVQMIPHHRAAIEMSRNVLQYTNCAPLRNIACNIISAQTQSIENMQRVLDSCRIQASSEQDLNLYQRRWEQIVNNMFEEMGTACSTNNISENFMWEMIPHHRGAVLMSENALRYYVNQELVPILEDIITSQKKGIREMEQLLENGCC